MRTPGKLFGKDPAGEVAADLTALVEAAQEKVRHEDVVDSPAGLSNGELLILAEVDNSLVATDQRSRRVRARGVRLQKAAHESERRWTILNRERHHPEWRLHQAAWQSHQAANTTRPRTSTTEDLPREVFDHHQRMSPVLVLAVFEVIFVVAETFFWYETFSQTAEPGFNEGRIAALLLAIAVPSLGLFGSYTAAKLLHRWVRGHSRADRRAGAGVLVASALFLVGVIAIVGLVSWRFDPDGGLGIGATEIPQWPMAIVFGTILLVDVTARTFLVSEIRTQYDRRRKRFDRSSNAYLRAAAEHDVAWTALAHAIQDRIDQARRIEAAGARVLGVTEARAGDPYRRHPIPPPVRALKKAGTETTVDDKPDTLSLPNPESLRLIQPDDILAPQGVLANAIHLLTTCPALSPVQARERVERLWQSLNGEPDHHSRPELVKSPRHPIGTGGHGADAVVSPR